MSSQSSKPTTTSTGSSSKKPAYPPVYYVSKSSHQQRRIRTNDLPHEPGARGIYSPWALLWGCLFAIVPVAYIYIVMILLRECYRGFPDFAAFLHHYVPPLATLIQQRLLLQAQQQQQQQSYYVYSSMFIEAWCVLEAVFYIGLKIHIRYLETRDPLEASLGSAPFLKPHERRILWERIMQVEKDDPAGYISGWFFDQDIHKISRYDIREFITWSMFEGRNQEHLTREELDQLENFVQQLEYRISIHWYGAQHAQVEEQQEQNQPQLQQQNEQPVPRKMFRFPEMAQHAPPNFFSNLYESYRKSYEKYRSMMMESTTDFRPMEDFWNFMATTTQQIIEAEESALATATQTAEMAMTTASQTATQMYGSIIQPVGQTFIQPGSQVEKRLTAIGQATHTQLIHAFHSVKQGMKERLETAKFLSAQRKVIQQQLKGYRQMLHRLREMSSEVPSQQTAFLMRRITESNQALERLENRAREAFVNATGYAKKNLSFPLQQEPQRYAKYSSDPLLGVATFPLGFHCLILGATEIPLRIMMAKRGFERKAIGSVNYYFHPGDTTLLNQYDDDDDDDMEHDHDFDNDHDDDDGGDDNHMTPIIFVHGIGIGLIVYMPLIDALLKLGRPLFLPEIPYVSGFRPWQGPNCVLPPAVVCSTMTAMLATHGYLRGTFAGHSYGTSWLSYMCKYAPTSVSALLFLDPICFCLHGPRLTKKFVYHRPDPGCISYIVRTDLIVNWTIQRSFPWAWIILFSEHIQVPCSVFLSDQDALVPAQKVEEYLRSKGASMTDFKPGLSKDHFFPRSNNENNMDGNSMINGCIFRGHGHGDWTDYPTHTVPVIADCLQVLCDRVESKRSR